MSADTTALHTPSLTHYFDVRVTMAPPVVVGGDSTGQKLIFNFVEGEFSGPYASGTLLPGGADWQFLRQDGVADIQVHCVLKTDDDVVIAIRSRGIRTATPEVAQRIKAGEHVPPSEYYFRTLPQFEVYGDRYPELSRKVFVAVGVREPTRSVLQVFAIE